MLFRSSRYLRDLIANRPPVFVDAVGPGRFTYTDRARDAHEQIPELRAYIEAAYIPAGEVAGVRFWMRRPAPPN